MILDSVTYGANIYADYECTKLHRRDDLTFKTKTHFASSLFSLIVILCVEAYVISDAIIRIVAPVNGEAEVNVRNKPIIFIYVGRSY